METVKNLIEGLSFRNPLLIVYAPMILMATDFFTGTLNAWIKRKVQSFKMRKGLAKKIGEMIAILMAEFFAYVFTLPIIIVAGISIYIMIMETISICENLDKLGVPIPRFIKRALSEAKEKIDEGGDSDNEKR